MLKPIRWLAAAIGVLIAVPALAGAASAPNYTLTSRISGPDGGWDYATFDPAKRRVYISRTDGVSALDVDSGVLNGHIADGQGTHKVIPLDDGRRLLVTNRGTNSARLLDASTGALIADIPAPKPDGALFHPHSGLVLVLSHTGDVTLIDPKAAKAVGTISIGGALEEAAADGDRAFVNVEDKNEIVAFSVSQRKILETWPLDGCKGPGGLAYAAHAGVLIAACGNGVAKVVRASDGVVVATLPIGGFPDAVIYDSVRRLAFIPCAREGVLEVIAVPDAGHVSLVQTAKTDIGARTGAVDEKTGKVYLPTAKYDMTAAATGRFTTLPGTFVVLVVSPN